MPRPNGARARILRLLGAFVALTVMAIAWPALAAASSGQVAFERNATSSFAIPWITESTPEQRSWMHDTYARMRGYPPFHDQALSWGPSTDFYSDLYAVYRDVSEDQALMQEHPDWILHDSTGHKLFIPYACSGGTCPAYAADVGNRGWQDHWIAAARAQLDKGYNGIFIDNVNMDMMVGTGDGDVVRPIDPRTGEPMTDTDWRRYVAGFTEQIRAAFPGVLITHNSGQWWTSESDPYYQREVAAADRVELERGFSDAGLTGGSDTFSFDAYLAHADWLHAQGDSFITEPYNLNADKALFEVASYLLVSEDGDAISSAWHANPDNWWSGWGTDLGAATGDRYTSQGLLRRDFANGVTLVNPPGGSTRTEDLPSDAEWTDLSGNRVTSVTLAAREGAVLVREPAGSGDGSGSSGEDVGGSVTIRSNRTRVHRGGRVMLAGTAPAAAEVTVLTRRQGSWHHIASDRSVAGSGAYRVRVKARPSGVIRYRARVDNVGSSRTVRVRVHRRQAGPKH